MNENVFQKMYMYVYIDHWKKISFLHVLQSPLYGWNIADKDKA